MERQFKKMQKQHFSKINHNTKPHIQEQNNSSRINTEKHPETSENYQENKQLRRPRQEPEKEKQMPNERIIQTEGRIRTL